MVLIEEKLLKNILHRLEIDLKKLSTRSFKAKFLKAKKRLAKFFINKIIFIETHI